MDGVDVLSDDDNVQQPEHHSAVEAKDVDILSDDEDDVVGSVNVPVTTARPTDVKDVDLLSDDEDGDGPAGHDGQAPQATLGSADAASTAQPASASEVERGADPTERPLQAPADLVESDNQPTAPRRGLRSVVTGHVDLADSSEDEGSAKKVPRAEEPEALLPAAAGDRPHDGGGPAETPDATVTSGAARGRGAAGRQGGRGRGGGRSRGRAAAKAGPKTSPVAEGEEALEQEARAGERPTAATEPQEADAKDVDMLSDNEEGGAAPVGPQSQAPPNTAESANAESTAHRPAEVNDVDVLSDAEDAAAPTGHHLQAPPNTMESDFQPTAPRRALRSVVTGHVDLADSSEDEASAKKVPRTGEPEAPLPSAVSDTPDDGGGPPEAADTKKATSGAARARGAGRQAGRGGGRGKSRGRGTARAEQKASLAEPREEATEQAVEAGEAEDGTSAKPLEKDVAIPAPKRIGKGTARAEQKASSAELQKEATEQTKEAGEAEDGTSAKPLERDVATPAPKRAGPPEQENSPSGAPAAKRARQADVAKEAKADSKAGDGKKEKLTKGQMESRVLEYMQKQNRPYNAQNVFDNLHGLVPKSQVQAILETLAGSNQIVGKEFGKAKVFLARQSASDDADGAEKKALQLEAEAANAEIREMKAKMEALRKSVTERRSWQSLSAEVVEAAEEGTRLEQRASEIRKKAEAAGETRDTDPQEVASVEEAQRGAKSEWRRRKRLCMEVLRSLKDATGVALEDLIDTYGVDTDEACGQLLEAQ